MVLKSSYAPVLIIIAGCILGLTSALVPHYNAGYKLMVSVLLAGSLPYLVYGIAIPYLRGVILIVPGLLMTATHFWLVMKYRFTLPVDYSDNWIYYGPLLLAAAVLPLAIRATRVPYTRSIAPESATQEQSDQKDPPDESQ